MITTPRWVALPQPSSVTFAGGIWAPPSVAIIATTPDAEPEAARFARELDELGVMVGDDASARILIGIDGPADESFRIGVGRDIAIASGTPAGLFRATRQLVHNLRAQGHVPRASVVSSPAVLERGVHLDAARGFYPAGIIEQLLHRAADLGLTSFQWHFSENEGFRIAHPNHPEVVSREHITWAEAEHLLTVAADLHLDVVPSFDMPGHLQHALRDHPGYRLIGDDRALDLSEPDAVDFAWSLMAPYVSLFGASTFWHLGADEYLDVHRKSDPPELVARAQELFGPDGDVHDLLTDFAAQLSERLIEAGFTPRVWNDGMFRSRSVHLPDRTQITWWTNWHAEMAPLATALNDERTVLNFDDGHLYYVLGEAAGYTYPTSARLWKDGWHPGLFPPLPSEIRQEEAAPYGAHLRGTYLSIWSDRPGAQSPSGVLTGIDDVLTGFAERSWNAGSALTHDDFLALRADLFTAPGRREM